MACRQHTSAVTLFLQPESLRKLLNIEFLSFLNLCRLLKRGIVTFFSSLNAEYSLSFILVAD